MSFFFKFLPFEGPKSIEFRDPDSGHLIKASSKEELTRLIVDYRATNNLDPLDHLPLLIEDYWCRQPGNESKCTEALLPRGFFPSVKAAGLILKHYLYKKTVPNELAEARAAQCVTCKFNVFPNEPGFIKYSNSVAVAMLGGEKRTLNHDKLGECAVCRCPLRGKVYYSGEVSLNEQQVKAMESVKCWQLSIRKE